MALILESGITCDSVTQNQSMNFVRALVGDYRLEVAHMTHCLIVIQDSICAQNLSGVPCNLQSLINIIALGQRNLNVRGLITVLQLAELDVQQLAFRNFRQHVNELLLNQLV